MQNESHEFPTLDDIFRARDSIGNSIKKTPLQRSETFSKLIGTNIFLKLESLQKTGSFKVRGALFKLGMLSKEEEKGGVIAASAGN
ncbi:MAG TPA: pyridoxal-phosphate dependent enzyme, partial [Nitrososphaeraceae archaeon]